MDYNFGYVHCYALGRFQFESQKVTLPTFSQRKSFPIFLANFLDIN